MHAHALYQRLIWQTVILLILVTPLYTLPPDFEALTLTLPEGSANTVVEQSALGQSLATQRDTVAQFTIVPVRVRLLTEHDELAHMIGVLTRYITANADWMPKKLVDSWQHLLEQSVHEMFLRRGAKSDLHKAVQEVVDSVVDATEALTRAVKACMKLLKELSSFVGLTETRAARHLMSFEREPLYIPTKDGQQPLREVLDQLDKQTDEADPRSKKWHGKLITFLSLAAIVAGVGIVGTFLVKGMLSDQQDDAGTVVGDLDVSVDGDPFDDVPEVIPPAVPIKALTPEQKEWRDSWHKRATSIKVPRARQTRHLLKGVKKTQRGSAKGCQDKKPTTTAGSGVTSPSLEPAPEPEPEVKPAPEVEPEEPVSSTTIEDEVSVVVKPEAAQKTRRTRSVIVPNKKKDVVPEEKLSPDPIPLMAAPIGSEASDSASLPVDAQISIAPEPMAFALCKEEPFISSDQAGSLPVVMPVDHIAMPSVADRLTSTDLVADDHIADSPLLQGVIVQVPEAVPVSVMQRVNGDRWLPHDEGVAPPVALNVADDAVAPYPTFLQAHVTDHVVTTDSAPAVKEVVTTLAPVVADEQVLTYWFTRVLHERGIVVGLNKELRMQKFVGELCRSKKIAQRCPYPLADSRLSSSSTILARLVESCWWRIEHDLAQRSAQRPRRRSDVGKKVPPLQQPAPHILPAFSPEVIAAYRTTLHSTIGVGEHAITDYLAYVRGNHVTALLRTDADKALPLGADEVGRLCADALLAAIAHTCFEGDLTAAQNSVGQELVRHHYKYVREFADLSKSIA